MEENKNVFEKGIDEAKNAVEEVVETAETTVEEVKETVTETLETTVEDAEETVTETLETTVEDAEETSEEAVEETKEEADEEVENAVSKKVKEQPVIKKKKLDKTNIIVIVVCAVVVLACLAFVAIKQGWIKFPKKAKATMEDYSVIEVLKSDVEVTDETVDSYISSLLSSQASEKTETEGVVAEGDLLDISFVGKLASTGELFEGGSAENQSCTVGAGQYIDGFDSALIGQKIGTTVTANVVFPEDYDKAELAGQPAIFDITINSRTTTTTPELNDEFVANYSYNYLPVQLNTVAELKQYVHDYIYKYFLHDAMMSDLQPKLKVDKYSPDEETNLVEYSKKSLEYNAAMYGYDSDTYAKLYGYASADEYALDMAHQYLNIIMIVDKVFKDKNLTVSQEELDQSIVEYMGRMGYNETYNLEEFKQESGEVWLYLYENLEYKYDKALTTLESNVQLVDELSRNKAEATEVESESQAQ